MPFWLSSLLEIFKGSDGHWDWTRIGAVLGAAGVVIAALVKGAWEVFKFRAERKKADEKNGGETSINVGQGFGRVRDQSFQAPVNFGLSPEQIEQIQRPWVELTNKLLAQHPAATPYAQQAIGEAVQAIAQGADAGDSLLEEALSLLQQNKPGEAVPLLEAFAKDKEAKIAKNRKETAIAYRNLGAIAGLGDPRRALEAYEKALALDPDDIKSLYWAGLIQIDYGDLGKAERRLFRVQELAQNGEDGFYKYAALGTLGDIKQRHGDLTGALHSYRDTIPIIDRLARSDPGNAGWQRDLSVSYNNVGGVQKDQGDLTGALKSYSDSLAISERLAKSDPGNAGWQRDLSVSYNKIGGVQEAQGDLTGALNSYSDSLAISERLAKSDPGNAGWQRDLSVSYDNVGGVQKDQGDLTGALKSYSDSLAIRERLAKSDPGNAGWQRDLSVSYDNVGGVQKDQGDLTGALKSYSDSLAIRERLAKSDPGNAGWQRDLSVSYDNVGGVQKDQGDLTGALKSYSDSLAISERLAKSDPGNAGWQRDLAVSFGKVALVHKQSGDSAKAGDYLRRGREIMARLAILSPDNAVWKNDLAWFDGQIAELAER